jgi:hypothetical protein
MLAIDEIKQALDINSGILHEVADSVQYHIDVLYHIVLLAWALAILITRWNHSIQDRITQVPVHSMLSNVL